MHGDTIRDGYAAAHKLIADLKSRVDVDLAEVADLLERQGVASFEKSWEELIASVTEQVEKAGASVMPGGAVKPANSAGNAPASAAPHRAA